MSDACKSWQKHKAFIYSGGLHREPGFLLQEYLVHTGTMQYSKYTRLFYFSIVNVRETSVRGSTSQNSTKSVKTHSLPYYSFTRAVSL